MKTTLDKLFQIIDRQKEIYVKMEEEILGIWLTILSGEHGFYLGEPGVAKSMLVADTCRYFEDFAYFFQLMNKHTLPPDLFGPTSISALRKDRHEFNTEGYLPEADIAFLDEGFKAGGSILNTLLGLMNERHFKHGATLKKAPLKSMFIASNEIPTDSELAAMYDRILFRFNVEDFKDPEDFRELLEREKTLKAYQKETPVATLTSKDYEEMRKAVDDVTLPKIIVNTLVDLRDTLMNDHSIKASPRRWLRAMNGIRAHAYLHGRKEATKADLEPLVHMLWTQPSQITTVNEVVWNVTNPILFKMKAQVADITMLLRDMDTAIANATRQEEETLVMTEYNAKINDVLDDVHRLRSLVPEKELLAKGPNNEESLEDKFDYMIKVLNGQKGRLSQLVMGIDSDALSGTIVDWHPEKVV